MEYRGAAAIGGLVAPGIATVTTAATAIAGTAISAASTATTAFATGTAAATTEGALFTRARFVDAERASVDLLAVQLAYGVLRVGFRGHCHEGESTGLARKFILHEEHFGYSAGLREHVLQLDLRCRERQVAYVQSISHISKRFWIYAPEGRPSAAGVRSLEETPMTDPAEPELFLCCYWHEE